MKEEPTEALFVKIADLARALGVSTRTVDSWLARRMIPYVAVSARMHLFNVKEVEAALRERFGLSAVK